MSLVDGMLEMYRRGWFPMAGLDGDPNVIEWTQPRQRWLIPLDDRFHVPRTLAAKIRQRRFTITSDQAFGQVIRSCAADRPAAEVWLHPDIIDAFLELHASGHAHSVEAWLPAPSEIPHGVFLREGMVLVGGLYGLAIGSVFCGESMFSRPGAGGTDASKVCLVHLVNHLRQRGFRILDAQLQNAHTAQFGGYEIAARSYARQLQDEAQLVCDWSPFGDSLRVGLPDTDR
jgi:leucyl/phenylalanyl-tRNA--protein transferase